jgi:hypothetical protein
VNVGDRVRRARCWPVFAPDTVRPTLRRRAPRWPKPGPPPPMPRPTTLAPARCRPPAPERSADQPVPHHRADRQGAREAAARCCRRSRCAGRNAGAGARRRRDLGAHRHGGRVVASGTELFRLIRQGRLEWRAEVTSTELGRIARHAGLLVTAPAARGCEGRCAASRPRSIRRRASRWSTSTSAAAAERPAAPAPACSRAATSNWAAAGAHGAANGRGAARGLQLRVRACNPDNRVVQMKVQIGRRLNDRIEILSGALPDGARVVARAAAS